MHGDRSSTTADLAVVLALSTLGKRVGGRCSAGPQSTICPQATTVPISSGEAWTLM